MVALRALIALATSAGLAAAWNVTVLPLGDSITYGYESTDGNGYREDLLELIQADGNTVDYIGSIQAGSMASRALSCLVVFRADSHHRLTTGMTATSAALSTR